MRWTILVLALAGCHRSRPAATSAPALPPILRAVHPLAFEPSREPRARFVARQSGTTIYFSDDGVRLASSSQAVKMHVAGARSVAPIASDRLEGYVNYLVGNDPNKWRTGVPRFGRVTYPDILPGIDLIYHGSQDGELEHDFVVKPGAHVSDLEIEIEGADIKVAQEGALEIGSMRQLAPVVYQDHPIAGKYRIINVHRIAFEVAEYDRTRPLVIDPVTYLGGHSTIGDAGLAIAIDASGSAYLTGQTWAGDFPTTGGAFQTSAPTTLGTTYVTKLSADGSSLVYSTYFGGNLTDTPAGIQVDSGGRAYITGTAQSTDFPTTPGAYLQVHSYFYAAAPFVSKFASDGKSLIYSTLIEDPSFGFDGGRAIAVDSAGAAYVTGRVSASQFPTTAGAYQTSFGGNSDAFITKVSSDGSSLVFSTYLGGTDTEEGNGIALDATGASYVAGYSFSTNFPVTSGSYQLANAGGQSDAFVTKVTADGTSLVYSTYLGGSNVDAATAIAADGAGSAFVVGDTNSINFPTTTGTFQTALAGGHDAFITKLASDGKSLVYSTYLGASNDDYVTSIALFSGYAFLSGYTQSNNFPTTSGAYQPTAPGGTDGFALKLATDGKSLVYSTYLGGNNDDSAYAIATDGRDYAYVTGRTQSLNFPVTQGAYQTSRTGTDASFYARVNCAPRAIGASCADRTDCQSTFCVDGICCNTPCAQPCGVCAAANGATTDGTCTAAPIGHAPSSSCGVYACSGTSVACPNDCFSDGGCVTGYYCATNATCQQQKAQATTCGNADCFSAGCRECSSGTCADGYCCDTPCGGECDVCSATPGTCTMVSAGIAASCAPYVCDGTHASCPTSCTTDDDCAPGNQCVAGSCGLLANGHACSSASECASGFCVGGVCCDQACSGACNQCSSGICGFSTAVCGAYVCSGASASCPSSCARDSECASGYYCASDGSCQQQREKGQTCGQLDCKNASCRECATGYCVDGVCCESACDKACDVCNVQPGTCTTAPQGTEGSCGGYVCDGTSTSCPTSCNTNVDCVQGGICTNGVCKVTLANGRPCTGANQCASGFCIDGFCCNTICAGACNACNQTGSLGTCKPVIPGSDARGLCPGGGPCKAVCTASGVCAYPDMTLTCGAASCSSSLVAHRAPTCDGHGSCAERGSISCDPYICQNGTCPSSCADATVCAPGHHCDSSSCGANRTTGAACTSDAQCASGYCTDGVCCGTRCDGACARCDLPNDQALVDGMCRAPVGQDPDGDCKGDGVCGGACQADGTCKFPSAELACDTCIACNGAGKCAAMPLSNDDPACQTIPCSGLSTDCRIYSDIDAKRCSAIGVCLNANDPAVCTTFSDTCLPDAGTSKKRASGCTYGGTGSPLVLLLLFAIYLRKRRWIACVLALAACHARPAPREMVAPVHTLGFERNDGQADARVRFIARIGGHTVYFTDDRVVFATREQAITMHVAGARAILPRASEARPDSANYFVGDDRSRWRTHIPRFARLTYSEVVPGVDLVFHGSDSGRLEHDFVVKPGARVEDLIVEVEGAPIQLQQDGTLAIGALKQLRPVVYQEHGISARYRVSGQQIAFEVSDYDRTRPLTVDPITYLGTGSDQASGIAVDASGNAYLMGEADSATFPTTAGAFKRTTSIGSCNFVSKFSADASALVYSTYLCGTMGPISMTTLNYGYAIAVDASGHAYATGATNDIDFPVTAGAFQTTGPTNYAYTKAFVTKLAADGGSLVYSTYLGGSAYDAGRAIAVDSSGDAYVAGSSQSTDFPTTAGAYQTCNMLSAFVTKLALDGKSLLYSTCVGTTSSSAQGVAVDASGSAFIAGYASSNHPVTSGAFQTALGGGTDAFVTKLATDGKSLVYSTLLGGAVNDQARGIAIDGSGNAYVAGVTASHDFPVTSGALQTALSGSQDAFVAKVAPDGASLVYSTYLGGSGNGDQASGIATNGGYAYVTGMTDSTDFPVTLGAYQATAPDNANAFVARIAVDGSSLAYSSYLGGEDRDQALAIAVDGAGYAHLGGTTNSASFPVTAGVYQPVAIGSGDAFYAKINCSPHANGSACTDATDCQSTRCIDGVCCDSACAGSCDVCTAALGATADGTCTLLPTGAMPTSSCGLFLCSGTSGACPIDCVADAACITGYYCAANGLCQPEKPQGSVCSAADCVTAGCRECASSHCVDGYCCDSACNGGCDACNATPGTCTTIAAGSPGSPACAPYLCDGAHASCPTSCTVDQDCTAGNTCLAGSCGLKANGHSCASPSDCNSGFCVGGLCCDQACAGACNQCSSGSCSFSTVACGAYQCSGTSASCPSSCRSDADCATGYYCAANGTCQEARTQGQTCGNLDCKVAGCRECTTGHCADGVCCESACDKACDVCSVQPGSCITASQGYGGTCGGYVCDGSNTSCPTSCHTGADCVQGGTCENGICKVTLADGRPCTAADQCASGFCVDGFCCNTICAGACNACNQTGSVGTCKPVVAGTDPRGLCPGTGPCKAVCNASGVCGYPDASLTCGAAGCSSELVLHRAATCDGHGSCADRGSVTCDPYVCQNGTCPSACADSTVCAPGHHCDTASCGNNRASGEACTQNAQCASGNCVDGVCCTTACGGACARCDLPNAQGLVDGICRPPVGQDPDDDCKGDGVCAGACQQDGTCKFPGADLACDTCIACDGAGKCGAMPQSNDDPACQTIPCSGLSSDCRGYTDITTSRCAAIGVCVTPNDPASCVSYTDSCSPDAGTSSKKKSSGCDYGTGDAPWALLMLGFAMVRRRKLRA